MSVFRERDIMSKLKVAQARYCIELHVSFQDDVCLYFLMEFVAGMSLHQLLLSYKRLPPLVYKTIAAMIVCGLEDIHNLNICHRDLKPGNILFTEDYKVRIADFGEAKMFEDLQKQKLKIQNDYDRNFGNRIM